MRALDLFCKAGGATRGLQQAGYHVTGVDIKWQPHYAGDTFIRGDALDVELSGFDLIWASPPCQLWSELTPADRRAQHVDLITPIRARLQAQGAPYIIENVAMAAHMLKSPIMLCGSMFGLDVWRHRYFEIGNADPFFLLPSCQHSFEPVIVSGRGMRKNADGRRWGGSTAQESRDAMGIQWMTRDELRQAIPPAYSRFLAEQIQEALCQV